MSPMCRSARERTSIAPLTVTAQLPFLLTTEHALAAAHRFPERTNGQYGSSDEITGDKDGANTSIVNIFRPIPAPQLNCIRLSVCTTSWGRIAHHWGHARLSIFRCARILLAGTKSHEYDQNGPLDCLDRQAACAADPSLFFRCLTCLPFARMCSFLPRYCNETDKQGGYMSDRNQQGVFQQPVNRRLRCHKQVANAG